MKKISFKIEGTQPLMLNNNQVVLPTNKYTLALKPLTSKRNKTEEDYKKIYELQFESSLYIKDNVYIIPGDHFYTSFITAAKEMKLGSKIERSLQIFEDCILDFPEKGMTPKELFKEGSHVDIRVGVINKKASVPVCRAIFSTWSTIVECWYDEMQLNHSDIVRIANIAGDRYGVGTYRKLFGRFSAKEIK